MGLARFESSVNSEGIETTTLSRATGMKFESSVNSEGIETHSKDFQPPQGLRAV